MYILSVDQSLSVYAVMLAIIASVPVIEKCGIHEILQHPRYNWN